MAQKLSLEEIREVADLALIALTDEEVASYQNDLGEILAYFEKLQEVDTDNVEEIGHITGMTNVYRKDVVAAATEEEKDAMLASVSAKKGRYIKVKNVL